MKLRVFFDHELIGEFPGEFSCEDQSGALLIRDAGGVEVRRFKAGRWHGAGHNLPCSYARNAPQKPECPNCGTKRVGRINL